MSEVQIRKHAFVLVGVALLVVVPILRSPVCRNYYVSIISREQRRTYASEALPVRLRRGVLGAHSKEQDLPPSRCIANRQCPATWEAPCLF